MRPATKGPFLTAPLFFVSMSSLSLAFRGLGNAKLHHRSRRSSQLAAPAAFIEEQGDTSSDFLLRVGQNRPHTLDIHTLQAVQDDLLDLQRAAMPERFSFDVFSQIFTSWFSALNGGVARLPDLSCQTLEFGVVYEHDHHKYLSEHHVSHYSDIAGNVNTVLCVKLPNNGFIYSKPVLDDGIKVLEQASQRHESITYVKLDASHLSQLSKLKSFAATYLQVPKLSIRMFYDYAYRKFAFKAYDSSDRTRGVVISFEDLQVMEDVFDDAYWLEVNAGEDIEKDRSAKG